MLGVCSSVSDYLLWEHKRKEHGIKLRLETRNVDVKPIVGEVDNVGLNVELEACKHSLTDSEI